MTGLCCDDDCALEALQARQRSTLVQVLWINAVMFLVLAGSALYGRSTSLLTDSFDDLGDALTYGLSLYAVSRGARTKARVALFKGALILLAALVVVGQVVWRLFDPTLPSYEVMGIFSVLAVVSNGVCLALLWRHRSEDLNMSSVYECSRNDIASNLSVVLAAGGVWLFESGWPDLLLASLLATMLLRSALRVLRGALRELRGHALPIEGCSS